MPAIDLNAQHYLNASEAGEMIRDRARLRNLAELLSHGPHGACTADLEGLVTKWASGTALSDFSTQLAADLAANKKLAAGVTDALNRNGAALNALPKR